MIRILFGGVAILWSVALFSCYVPPEGILRDHSNLVSESQAIVLVKAIGAAKEGRACTLEVTQILKGKEPKPMPLTCRQPGKNDWMTSFSGHTDPAFWKERAGRLGVNGDCSVVDPAFSIGNTYLLLLGSAADTKSFEEIAGPDDKWLMFVQAQLTKQ